MTVVTLVNTTKATADGATLTFAFTFYLLAATDLFVYLNNIFQATGYAVNINVDGVGGTIVFTTAPPTGTIILMQRVVPLTQETQLPTEADMPEQTLEDMIDRAVMITQQLNTQITKCLALSQFSVANVTLPLTLADPVANNLLAWDPTGMFVTNVPPAGSVASGNVTGPAGGSVAFAIGYFADTSGKSLTGLGSVGTANQLLVSNGPGVPPSFQTVAGLANGNSFFRPSGITATSVDLPTSGALSGTYVRNGAWTSTGTLTFTHNTRIYVNGNFTLNHAMTGVVQNNGGVSASKAQKGGDGGGIGPGVGGLYLNGGGSGGGSNASGGVGGYGTALNFNPGGVPHSNPEMGGSGGGSGAGSGNFAGGVGGAGGPFILIEVFGNVVINAALTANGAAGTNSSGTLGGAGGGGGGGQVIIRNSGTFQITATNSVNALGGAGGNLSGVGCKGGGGAGGYIEVLSGGAQTLTGSLNVTGGAKGTGAANVAEATAGGNGTSFAQQNKTPASFF